MLGRDILTWCGELSFKVQRTEEQAFFPSAVRCGVHREFCVSVPAKYSDLDEHRRSSFHFQLEFGNWAAWKCCVWLKKLKMAPKHNPLKLYQNSPLQEATIQSANLTYFCVLPFFFLFLYFQTLSTKKTLTIDTETVQFGVIIFPPIDLMKDF